MQTTQKINIGIIGLGDWGRNHVRIFSSLDDCTLTHVCDVSDKGINLARKISLSSMSTKSFKEVVTNSTIDAIIIATTSETHYEIARDALLEGKHVFVEKPFVLRLDHAEELIEIAAQHNRVLMVGHLLLHHPIVKEMKKRIESEELGDVLYIYSTRINLGKVRSNENALWSFAPHDISTMNYLIGNQPVSVNATGQSFLNHNIHDAVFFSLNYPNKVFGHGHVSWLDPHKKRSITVVGSKKMFVFDDTESNDKLKIHDKGINVDSSYQTFGEYMTLRQGDVSIPFVKMVEPLIAQAREFISCIRENRQPVNNGEEGLQVLKILLACQESLSQGGKPISI